MVVMTDDDDGMQDKGYSRTARYSVEVTISPSIATLNGRTVTVLDQGQAVFDGYDEVMGVMRSRHHYHSHHEDSSPSPSWPGLPALMFRIAS